MRTQQGRGEETVRGHHGVGGHHGVRGQGCKLKKPGGPGGAPESPPEVEVQRMLSTGAGQRSRESRAAWRAGGQGEEETSWTLCPKGAREKRVGGNRSPPGPTRPRWKQGSDTFPLQDGAGGQGQRSTWHEVVQVSQ